MNTELISASISLLALVISMVGVVRTRKISTLNVQMQTWTWRQKYLQSVVLLTKQLSDTRLAMIREERQNDLIQKTLEWAMRQPDCPVEATDKLRSTVESAKTSIHGLQQRLEVFEKNFEPLWSLQAPTTDQDAFIQKAAAELAALNLLLEARSMNVKQSHEAIVAVQSE